jgi:hypothetical protein
MRNVALGVHLRLLALGRRRKRYHAENARAHPLGHGFDRAALAGSVAPFEKDAELQALVHHPLLEFDELDMQAREFPLIFLPLRLTIGCKIFTLLVGHRFTHRIGVYINQRLISVETRAMIQIRMPG